MGRTELTNSYQTSRAVCKHSANKYFIGFTTAISDVRQASHCLCDECLQGTAAVDCQQPSQQGANLVETTDMHLLKSTKQWR